MQRSLPSVLLLFMPVASVLGCGTDEIDADGSASSEHAVEGGSVPDGERGGAAELIERLPNTCSLLTSQEAERILGQPAQLVDLPGGGAAGGLCRYRASQERELRLGLMEVELDQFDARSDPIERLVSALNRTRTSGPDLKVWDDAPGLGGLHGDSDRSLTTWTVTPYQVSAMMSDRPVSQVLLGVFVVSPAGTAERSSVAREAASLIIPRIGEAVE